MILLFYKNGWIDIDRLGIYRKNNDTDIEQHELYVRWIQTRIHAIICYPFFRFLFQTYF